MVQDPGPQALWVGAGAFPEHAARHHPLGLASLLSLCLQIPDGPGQWVGVALWGPPPQPAGSGCLEQEVAGCLTPVFQVGLHMQGTSASGL